MVPCPSSTWRRASFSFLHSLQWKSGAEEETLGDKWRTRALLLSPIPHFASALPPSFFPISGDGRKIRTCVDVGSQRLRWMPSPVGGSSSNWPYDWAGPAERVTVVKKKVPKRKRCFAAVKRGSCPPPALTTKAPPLRKVPVSTASRADLLPGFPSPLPFTRRLDMQQGGAWEVKDTFADPCKDSLPFPPCSACCCGTDLGLVSIAAALKASWSALY